jgi:hypothetical protein
MIARGWIDRDDGSAICYDRQQCNEELSAISKHHYDAVAGLNSIAQIPRELFRPLQKFMPCDGEAVLKDDRVLARIPGAAGAHQFDDIIAGYSAPFWRHAMGDCLNHWDAPSELTSGSLPGHA